MVDRDNPFITPREAIEMVNDLGLFAKVNDAINDGLKGKTLTLNELFKSMVTGEPIMEGDPSKDVWIRVIDVNIIFNNIKRLIGKYVEAIRS